MYFRVYDPFRTNNGASIQMGGIVILSRISEPLQMLIMIVLMGLSGQ